MCQIRISYYVASIQLISPARYIFLSVLNAACPASATVYPPLSDTDTNDYLCSNSLCQFEAKRKAQAVDVAFKT